jgi:hypothetical protein
MVEMLDFKQRMMRVDQDPNFITEQLNMLDSVEEARALVLKDPWGVWSEYPRGVVLLDRLISGICTCKYSLELQDLASSQIDEWYQR